MIRVEPRYCVCKEPKSAHVGGLGKCIACEECRRFHEAYRFCPECGSSALTNRKKSVVCLDCTWKGAPTDTLSVLESTKAAEIFWKKRRSSAS